MEDKYTLIVPMINTSKRYENIVPIEFQYDNECNKMNCIKSIEGINTDMFSIIYFVILKKHEDRYHISSKITLDVSTSEKLKDIPFKFIILPYPTSSQAETIYKTITCENIVGPIFIKDADNGCVCDVNKIGNFVLVYQLENTKVVDPQHKSYVSIDDQNFITNIIEKRIISSYFNCGGYTFSSAQDYVKAYEGILKYEDLMNHMYISHLIYWLLINKKMKFRPIEATYYDDYEIKNIINE